MVMNWILGFVLEKKIWIEGLFILFVDVEGV